ncbi:cysteine desulfuration protein SufE [Thiogranum longum]|uniref:Cysteine desulfuration protein SufE n=1 Tax=Thiogranum longum TaxID=1537524 RepID=A0A4R1HAY9_9GAMM|nr:SufE family protein [Thiogranum longum]TCK17761.1 cysteine desulfuration protein SufE [Thiogranum longum]
MASLDDIVENFNLLGDWEQRYLYLTELGKKLPAMPDELKTGDNRVKGCMSKVWVSACHDEGDASRIRFHGDCDTSTIKGVLAILIELASGRTAEEIEKLDVDEVFERLHLYEHLSPNRHVGVYAIVELMKQQVRGLAKEVA